MLLLINEPKNRIQIFQDYNGLYTHLESHERQKHARKGHHQKTQPWVFARHSHQRMTTYQDALAKQAANGNGTDSREAKGWDIIEIVSGNPAKPVFIPLVHNLDIEPLRKNWCAHYCKAHNLNLIEIMAVSDFRKLKAAGK
jgi:hypothetical protein